MSNENLLAAETAAQKHIDRMIQCQVEKDTEEYIILKLMLGEFYRKVISSEYFQFPEPEENEFKEARSRTRDLVEDFKYDSATSKFMGYMEERDRRRDASFSRHISQIIYSFLGSFLFAAVTYFILFSNSVMHSERCGKYFVFWYGERGEVSELCKIESENSRLPARNIE